MSAMKKVVLDKLGLLGYELTRKLGPALCACSYALEKAMDWEYDPEE